MAGAAVSANRTVVVGQVWVSTDPREKSPRPFRIAGFKDTQIVFVRDLDGKRPRSVKIARLQPGSTGYRLVEDAESMEKP